jgi:hypothetical protein
MPSTEPFSIVKYAATFEEFKKLPLDTQAVLLLKRLRQRYHDHKVQPQRFCKANFVNRAARTSDPEGLAVEFPENERMAVVEHLLGAPWLHLEQEFYITSTTGDGCFEITQPGLERTDKDLGIPAPNRTTLAALNSLHPDLQDYDHYFYEGKLKDAVSAAFKRVENRLNEIRDSSTNRNIKSFSGTALPRKLIEFGVLKFPYPNLASANPTSREAYSTELKNLLSSSVGWFRNSFQHEPHNLPDFDENETLEHLFVASYILHLIDRAI